MSVSIDNNLDTRSIKQQINKSLQKSRLKTFLLVLPVLLFIMVSFVFPITDMLIRSIQNNEIPTYLPKTIISLQHWDGNNSPSAEIYDSLLYDLTIASKNRTIGKLATRMNYEASGMRSLFSRTARKLRRHQLTNNVDSKAFLIGIHKEWGKPEVFNIIKRESSRFTKSYYLSAVDLQYDNNNKVVAKPEESSLYLDLFLRTFWMSAIITLLACMLGYPLAFLLANLPVKYANLLMILVLLPFWTSLLVRTSTWIVILQTHGVLNDLMVLMGVLDEQSRMQMIHNITGTLIAMTHILLPFMILPLYSVMKTINPSLVRAARSLGGNAFHAFRKIYFPLTLPGLGAGSMLVFILSIGYYITPALVGGQSGRFITNMIAHHMNSSLNWGLAAALASILLLLVIVLYFIYGRFMGTTKIKLG